MAGGEAALLRVHMRIFHDRTGVPVGLFRSEYQIQMMAEHADRRVALPTEDARGESLVSASDPQGLRDELEFPGRAVSLTLLDPGGLGRIGARCWAWLIAGGLAGLTPGPVRRRLAGPVRNATLREEQLMPLLPLTTAFRRRPPLPDALTDDQLRQSTTPTLVLLGEHSVLYPAADVAARLTRAMPDAHVEIVPGASHDLPVHSPALVADRIEAFLAG
jgi:pimeloyl-ACP methyl ester carboxylesterase